MSGIEIFFSVDVESDGPIPGPNSMLSFGCAAFKDYKMASGVNYNLKTLEGASGDPSTMEWWGKQPDAWEACRKDLVSPEYAMTEFVKWVEAICDKHKGRPVFVGYPTGYDFTFMYWYLIKFTGKSPFSFSALDVKTMAWVMLGCRAFKDASKKNFPKYWFGNHKHTHIALDDAIEQGEMFCNMLREVRK
jgi:hypothetical protein